MIADLGMNLFDYGEERHEQRTEITIVRKFRRTFRRVWKKLPETDRSTLLKYWTSRRRNELVVRIAVAGAWHPHLKHRVAACAYRGFELIFHNDWIEHMPGSKLAAVVAHELGHSMSYAHGWSKQHKCLAMQGLECVACECRAQSYMAAWGYNPFFGKLFEKKHRVVNLM